PVEHIAVTPAATRTRRSAASKKQTSDERLAKIMKEVDAILESSESEQEAQGESGSDDDGQDDDDDYND
ncbi:hypothetical protein BGZ46_007858, partial [Entomortierella lignicola]